MSSVRDAWRWWPLDAEGLTEPVPAREARSVADEAGVLTSLNGESAGR